MSHKEPPTRPQIAYYISSHGLGHAVRSIEIAQRLEEGGADCLFVTKVSERILRQSALRSIGVFPKAFDCGCVQVNATSIDWEATFSGYLDVEIENERRLEDEAEWLRETGARVVVSDIPAFAVEVAGRAGLPCLLIANFTWADIYGPMASRHARGGEIARRLEDRYAQADLLLRTPLGLSMDYVPRVTDVPVVARQGRPRREELCRALGLDADRMLVLLYVGRWGLETVEWRGLRRLPDVQFVTMGAPPASPTNLTAVSGDEFRHEDLTASVDAVVAKPGYGICGECLAASTPLIYPGREEFAEFPAIDAALRRWGGGVRMDEADLLAMDLGPYLERLDDLSIDPDAFATDGAQVCADIILDHCR